MTSLLTLRGARSWVASWRGHLARPHRAQDLARRLRQTADEQAGNLRGARRIWRGAPRKVADYAHAVRYLECAAQRAERLARR